MSEPGATSAIMQGGEQADRVVNGIESLAEVEPAAWDLLAARRSFYLSHSWLRQIEHSGSGWPRYIMLTGHAGSLRAAMPYYLVSRESNDFYRLDLLGLDPQPSSRHVVLGTRRGYNNGLLLAADADVIERRELQRTLGAQIHAVLEEFGGAGWWLYVTDDQVADVCAATACPVPIFLQLEGRIELPGDGWSDFLASLRSDRRQKLGREDLKFAQAGYTVIRGSLAQHWNSAGPLLANTLRRYGHRDDSQQGRDYLKKLTDGAADPGSVLLCRRDGHLVGYCHYYDFGDTRWLRSVGFDYERLRGAYEYFALAYYLQIRDAYATGRRSIHCGIGSLQAKALRGARLCPLWAVPVGTAAQAWPARRCRMRNGAALAAAHRDLGRVFAAVDQSRWLRYT